MVPMTVYLMLLTKPENSALSANLIAFQGELAGKQEGLAGVHVVGV
jgi:hypothetical protein